MFFDPRSKAQTLQKTCFKPCLWFSSKYEKDKFRDNSQYLNLFYEIDKFDDLDQDEKLKILRRFNLKADKNNKNGKSKDFVNAKKISRFIKHNYSFNEANKKLFECISYLNLSRDYFHSTREDQFEKSISIADEYFKKYQFPFKWMSSNSLYTTHQPLFYNTNSLREHAIFLCWRVVFLCLNYAMTNIDYCQEFSMIIQNSDKRFCHNSNLKKYKSSKNYLFYALFLLNQVIPCQMRQFSGTLVNQSMTSGGITIPELNPHVVSSFAKLVHGILQQNFFVNIVSYYTLKMAKRVESIESVTKILNYKNQIQNMSIDQIDFMELKKISCEAVDCVLNVLFDDESTVSLISGLFKIYHDTLVNLSQHCWNYQLDSPYHDVNFENQRFIFTTEISKFYFESYIERFKSVKKEKTSVEIYRRIIPALSLRNFLIGSCITLECLLCCYNIAQDDYGDEIVLPKLVNLAKKVEILLLPIFDREEIAIELVCWILHQLQIRKTLCERIEELVFESSNAKKYYEGGKQISFITLFMTQKVSRFTPTIRGSARNIGSMFSNLFKFRSQQNSDPLVQATMSSMREALDLPETAESSKSDERRVLSPFNQEDVYLWTVLIGLYPFVNDSKTSLMPTIELSCFDQYRSQYFVPDTFYQDYNEQMFRWMSKIVEFKESILL